jgi:chromosome segregation ATPase
LLALLQLSSTKKSHSDKVLSLTTKLVHLESSASGLESSLQTQQTLARTAQADFAASEIESDHLRARLDACKMELDEASGKLNEAKARGGELELARGNLAELTSRNMYLEDKLRNGEGMEEELEKEIGRERREGRRREGKLKMAMSQWESLLDLYIGDFVVQDHKTEPERGYTEEVYEGEKTKEPLF